MPECARPGPTGVVGRNHLPRIEVHLRVPPPPGRVDSEARPDVPAGWAVEIQGVPTKQPRIIPALLEILPEMLYPNSTTSPGESGVVHALGQTWYFTQGAVRALRLYGVAAELSLKAVVIELTTFDGLEAGIHEVNFSSVPLRLYVDGSQVVVEDPEHPND